MRELGLLVVMGFAVACSGADTSLSSGDGGGDEGNADAATPPSDSGQDAVVVVNCDGGQTSCGGECVDTQTDWMNCGGCGDVCNTSCIAGVCPLFGADAGTPPQVGDNACLTVDATNVYWGTGFGVNGQVWKVPIGGGTPTVMIGNQNTPHGMASDGTNLFYADQGSSAGTGTINRIPINGNASTPIATSQSTPDDVAVDATNVYWTNVGDGSVWKSDKSTPNPIKLAGPNGANHAAFLRVDATNVYFTDPTTGVINSVPIATGAVKALTTTGIPIPTHIAIDSSNAYVASRNGSVAAVLSIALNATSGTPVTTFPNLPSIAGIETDGTSIWFAELTDVQPYQANTGEIHRITTAGGSDKILASKQNQPNCISVDSTSVYWINVGDGLISKTGK